MHLSPSARVRRQIIIHSCKNYVQVEIFYSVKSQIVYLFKALNLLKPGGFNTSLECRCCSPDEEDCLSIGVGAGGQVQ